MTKEDGISARALAKLLGISHTQVNAAVAAGRIRRGADGLFHPATAIRDWHDSRRPRVPAAGAGAPEPLSGPSLSRLHQADLALKVEERKVRLDERKGRLIDRDKAGMLVRRLAQEERDAILAFPTRWAALIAARLSIDPHELQKALDEALRTHLAERAGPEIEL